MNIPKLFLSKIGYCHSVLKTASSRRSYHGLLLAKVCLSPSHILVENIRYKTRAVIFDMGGVVLKSPFPLTRAYEDERGIPPGTIWKCIEQFGADGSWPKLEIGELNSEEFGVKFSEECSVTAGQSVELHDFLEYLENGMGDPIPEVLDAVRAIKAEGIKTALLTNNWKNSDGSTLIPIDQSIFDVVVESAVAGINKPNPVIYNKCLNALGVKAEDAIFLDDIGSNIKAAKSLGIRCIKVENIPASLAQLEQILQFSLSNPIPETKGVRKGMEISERNLEKNIQNTLKIHSHTGLHIRQFAHGQSNPTYYIEYGDMKAVLRKKPPGKLLPSAHAIEREYRVMSAMKEAGVPIPTLLSLCEDSSILGTPFYLMKYVDGNVYKNPLLPDMPAEKRRRIYHNLADTLCNIHSVNIDNADLTDFGKYGNYVERQVITWSRQYKATETHNIPAMNRLIEWLPQHLPKNESTVVVHGDYRLDNLIFHPETDEVLAVLDWELSTLGDPLSDLAYMGIAHYLPKNIPILPGMAEKDLERLGIPSMKELMHRYCSKTNTAEVSNFNFYMAFTFFRVASILQGVFKRSKMGQASSASANAAGSLAEQMADIGWNFACKEGFRVFNDSNRILLKGKP
uniref:acyl-CoA dehydrogenase family member 10-like n=1 Tax=Styela clava TaxID=7725 RepID=UPI0019392E90|nr:acyl-CoA dehydrogenase family member 10-like [Styela clava]